MSVIVSADNKLVLSASVASQVSLWLAVSQLDAAAVTESLARYDARQLRRSPLTGGLWSATRAHARTAAESTCFLFLDASSQQLHRLEARLCLPPVPPHKPLALTQPSSRKNVTVSQMFLFVFDAQVEKMKEKHPRKKKRRKWLTDVFFFSLLWRNKEIRDEFRRCNHQHWSNCRPETKLRLYNNS